MPGLADGSASRLLARGCRRRQRLDGWGCRDGAHRRFRRCGCCVRQATWASAQATTSRFETAPASWSCSSTPTPSFPRGRSTTRRGAAVGSGGRRAWSATGGRRRQGRAVVRAHAEPLGRSVAAMARPRAAARGLADARVGRVEHATGAHGRMGQWRVPARPPGRCGRGRAPGRAVLPLLGRRRLLRFVAGGRTAHPLHACCRGHPRAGTLLRRRGGGHRGRLPARTAGVLSQVAPGLGDPAGAGTCGCEGNIPICSGSRPGGRLELRVASGPHCPAAAHAVFAHGSPAEGPFACALR